MHNKRLDMHETAFHTQQRIRWLAVLEDVSGLEQLEERWKPYGYNFETAMQAKAAYEEWAKEEIHFDCLDDAILGTNESGGLFPARLEAFFAGWISSANA
jgi:hypothetical protein